MVKISIDQIKDEAALHDWSVVSQSYKNLTTDMTFICGRGHEVVIPYGKIRTKWECPLCKNVHAFSPLTKIPKTEQTRILALDQATIVSGWSLYDGRTLIDYGTIKIKDDLPTIERIEQVRQWVLSAIENFEPDIIAIEDIQLQETQKSNPYQKSSSLAVLTYRTLAELIGVLSNAIYTHNIELVIVHSASWRHHCGITGVSRADKKKSAQLYVERKYNIKVINDISDAICIGQYVAETSKKQITMKSWNNK